MTDLMKVLIDSHEEALGSSSGPRPGGGGGGDDAGGHGRTWIVLTLLWTLLYGAGLFTTLDRRFDRSFDLNSGIWTIAGRNLIRDGFFSLRGGCYVSAGQFPRTQREFYGSHPPLLTWLMAGWMSLVGQSDLATRALPLAFSLLNVLLIYALARRALGPPAGFFAAVLYSLMPMTAYFSQVINMEPFVMTAILGASLAYGRVCRRQKFGWPALLGCIALGCWMDWPMFIFAGFLAAAHFLMRPGWRNLRQPALIALTPLLVFAVFIAYLRFNQGNFYEKAIERAKIRMRVAPLTQQDQYVIAGPTPSAKPLDTRPGYRILFDKLIHPRQFYQWLIALLTPTICLLALISLLSWRGWMRDSAGDEPGHTILLRLILVTLLAQLVYTAAFAEGATRHEYWQYFLAMPLALLAAGLCAWAARQVMSAGVKRTTFAGLGILLIAAATPALVWRPFAYRIDPPNTGKPSDFHFDYIESMGTYIDARDLIIVRAPNLGTALAWYADRMILSDKPIFTFDDLAGYMARYPRARTLYLCDPQAPVKLVEILTERYPLYRAGSLEFFLLRGQPDARWKRVESAATKSAAVFLHHP